MSAIVRKKLNTKWREVYEKLNSCSGFYIIKIFDSISIIHVKNKKFKYLKCCLEIDGQLEDRVRWWGLDWKPIKHIPSKAKIVTYKQTRTKIFEEFAKLYFTQLL